MKLHTSLRQKASHQNYKFCEYKANEKGNLWTHTKQHKISVG